MYSSVIGTLCVYQHLPSSQSILRKWVPPTLQYVSEGCMSSRPGRTYVHIYRHQNLKFRMVHTITDRQTVFYWNKFLPKIFAVLNSTERMECIALVTSSCPPRCEMLWQKRALGFLNAGVQNFRNIQQPPQNFGRRAGDRKQVSYSVTTTVWRHRSQFKFVHPCCNVLQYTSSYIKLIKTILFFFGYASIDNTFQKKTCRFITAVFVVSTNYL